jgi:hypothetical protein
VAGASQLAFEIVDYTPDATVANARVNIKVKLLSISSVTPTTFYAWWGNPSATLLPVTDTYGRNNVWTNGFVGVFQMAEFSGSTATNSVGSNNGTYQGTSFPNRVDPGPFQLLVNANSNRISLGGGSPWNITGAITITTVMGSNSWTSAWQALVVKGDGTYRLHRNNATDNLVFTRTTGGTSRNATNTADISSGRYHIAATFSTSVGSYLYVDGTPGTLQSNTTATDSNADVLYIGRNSAYTARDWDGWIGATTIANVARSAEWIETEYNTRLNYSSFISDGTPESAGQFLELGINF